MKTMLKKLLFFMLILPLSVLAQNTFSGKVIDASSNQVMPGVSVTIEGTTTGTFSDSEGVFTLRNIKSGNAVSFSFLGYKTETIIYENQQNVTISLQQEGQGIEEVVVIGYGKVKKKDATGAVTQISSKDFNKGATPTVENLLNGRVAGLQINTGGGPASGSAIRIRGGASINASNDPLIVVDGLPISNDTPAGSRNFLATLDPNTIESISVLKDASATAIYGSRASNGVIIITTKKGGKTLKVDYNFQYGSGKHYRKIDVLSSDEFVNAIRQYQPTRLNELGVDDPSTSVSDDPLTPNVIEGRIIYNTDWQEELFKRTDYVNNNLNVSGSLFDAIPARLSLGNTYQEGLILTDKFNRTSAGLNLSPSLLKDHLKLTLNANFSNEKNNFAKTPIGGALRFDPTKPIYNLGSQWGGYYEHTAGGSLNGNLLNGGRNPIAEVLQSTNNGKVNRLLGNFQIDYKMHFLPELRAVVNLGYDSSKGEGVSTVAKNAAVSDGNGGRALSDKFGEKSEYNSTFTNKLLDAYLVYNKTFSKLDFEGTAGYSYQKFEAERFSSGNIFNPNSVADVDTATDKVLIGFFARTNFTYNDKYLLTLTYRRDGTSVFIKENQFGNFPAASFAWKLNNEFFKDSKTISDLKLRLGWGISGQQDLGRNDYFQQQYISSQTNGSQYTFGNTPIVIGLPKDYNTKLKWEETTTYNVGLDYGFFNNRISGSIEGYYKISDDLLFNAPFPDGSNFANNGPQNIGSLDIKGVELNLNADIVKKQDFTWNVNFNASKFERRIKELKTVNNTPTGGIGGGTGGNIQVFSEGWTPNSFYVYKQLYNTDGTPIQGAYSDLNGDNIINEKDKYIYKNTDPDVLMGFQSTMNYKNIDFSFNLRASIGNRMYNNVNSANAYTGFLVDNDVLANIPSSTFDTNFTNSGNNVIFSDHYIENASFLKMDNVTLGYTFPKWLEGKASVRLSAGIQNAFVITKYSGLDPEVFNGIDNTIYPRQRQILFGANIKF
jgi:TonB-linked SusC/RagA family outer membrane protein